MAPSLRQEALVDGSLELYVGLSVHKPGRYVLRARVDDVDGEPFAYLTDDEQRGRGVCEAKLRLFGRLVRDLHGRAPFRLRDLEGFLFEEDAYPDRETVPGLDGAVHETQRYGERDFSDAAWESDEKTRRLHELTKDVENAKAAD